MQQARKAGSGAGEPVETLRGTSRIPVPPDSVPGHDLPQEDLPQEGPPAAAEPREGDARRPARIGLTRIGLTRIGLTRIGLLLVGLLLMLLLIWRLATGGQTAGDRFAASQITGSSGKELLPDREISVQLREFQAAGDEAVPSLVGLLNDPRESVADGAYRGLTDRLDRWRMVAVGRRNRSAGVLAEELARQSPRFSRGGKLRAAELATRLLRERDASGSAEAVELAAACQQILNALAPAEKGIVPQRFDPLAAAADPAFRSGNSVGPAAAGSPFNGLPPEITGLRPLSAVEVPQFETPPAQDLPAQDLPARQLAADGPVDGQAVKDRSPRPWQAFAPLQLAAFADQDLEPRGTGDDPQPEEIADPAAASGPPADPRSTPDSHLDSPQPADSRSAVEPDGGGPRAPVFRPRRLPAFRR